MKRFLLITCGVILFAPIAWGQAGGIGLYFDQDYHEDCYHDVEAALVQVYVVHMLTPGATASQFMVIPGGGFNCTFTGEVIAVPVSIGSSLGGLSASYGGCMVYPILISTMSYFCMGTSPACAYLQVVPDPAAPTGEIEVVDCSFVKRFAVGGTAYLNPSGACELYCIHPTEQTSWGKVKVLYE